MSIARLHRVAVSDDFPCFYRLRVDAVVVVVSIHKISLTAAVSVAAAALSLSRLARIKCVGLFAVENRFSV